MKSTTLHPKSRAAHSSRAWAARFLLLLLLALPAAVQAQFNYTAENGQITITGYTGPGGAVNIPSAINGLPVTRIRDYGFRYNANLTSVTIPNGVTSIGVVAFGDCTNSTGITIPKTVTSIGDQAFSGCTSLIAITVEILNAFYSSVDGVLFDRNQTMLILYPGGRAGGYIIPNTATRLGDWAFSGRANLTSVTIPNSVTTFGVNVFSDCTGLRNVAIPNGITNMGFLAFSGCTSLTSVTISSGVTKHSDIIDCGCSSGK